MALDPIVIRPYSTVSPYNQLSTDKYDKSGIPGKLSSVKNENAEKMVQKLSDPAAVPDGGGEQNFGLLKSIKSCFCSSQAGDRNISDGEKDQGLFLKDGKTYHMIRVSDDQKGSAAFTPWPFRLAR
ncbi:hypothetical protein [Erwinia psidii]|uniref:Uncharacterized protein n=1 Tax=Erwinia psidii TaxID=69224 RepID=A0A3N6RYS4_9GAMM|nr:hypothetical protein [Erwinia psidii]MCX8957263.1 hypothetical protein [Erwinia psidii]MCX8959633.1 hypothetical protein [Erwinia psidii]MCX8964576.1 hypothetical protein [Erwinia psidii]RQM38308.1 hypothetical protein EB241_11265 [Erwinia psidii]